MGALFHSSFLLRVVNILINGGSRHQLLVIANRADHAVIHNHDQIGILHRCDTLSDNQLGSTGDFLPEGLADHSIGGGIHRGGRVVQNQNFRLLQQRTGNAQALLLTAGNIGTALLNAGIVAVGERGDKVVGAGKLTGMDQFFIGSLRIAPAQIFLDRTGEENVLLQHHGTLSRSTSRS